MCRGRLWRCASTQCVAFSNSTSSTAARHSRHYCTCCSCAGDASTGYFGIYDGHGGRNVAEFLRLHLHVNVEKELKGKGDRTVEECIKTAFVVTDIECSTTGTIKYKAIVLSFGCNSWPVPGRTSLPSICRRASFRIYCCCLRGSKARSQTICLYW
jgi:hypothetical protein